jgi:predicted nicotinamide N-methyase
VTADPTQFIRANLPIAPAPGIPEVRLHKALPTSRVGRLAALDEEGFGSPYWAYHWGGGLALARYVLDHPEIVTGRAVLDLGAGSGLVAIAAAKAGAASVVAAEIDSYAVAALRLNIEANQVDVAIVHGDLTSCAPPDVDVVLAGDLFYNEALAETVTVFLDLCLAADIAVLIGDPWRAFLPRRRLRKLADHLVAETGEEATMASAVFAFEAGRANTQD